MANTGRMNLLEEEGRIKSEPQTKNVKAEEKRVVGEIKKGYKTGGRVGLKHGSYKRVPLSHADISKYVTKRGKSEGPKGEDTNYRRTEEQKKGTTLTMKTAKKRMGPAGQPTGFRRPKGGWSS